MSEGTEKFYFLVFLTKTSLQTHGCLGLNQGPLKGSRGRQKFKQVKLTSDFLLMSKKDKRSSSLLHPCYIWAPDACILFPESEDTDVIKYASDLLQSTAFFYFNLRSTPKKVFEDSAWRGETTAMKAIVPVLPKVQGTGYTQYHEPEVLATD